MFAAPGSGGSASGRPEQPEMPVYRSHGACLFAIAILAGCNDGATIGSGVGPRATTTPIAAVSTTPSPAGSGIRVADATLHADLRPDQPVADEERRPLRDAGRARDAERDCHARRDRDAHRGYDNVTGVGTPLGWLLAGTE